MQLRRLSQRTRLRREGYSTSPEPRLMRQSLRLPNCVMRDPLAGNNTPGIRALEDATVRQNARPGLENAGERLPRD